MKANEAPERIYISFIPSISGGHVYTTVNKDFPNAVEYTRTDAFVEKACEWIKSNITNNPNTNSVLVRNGCVTLGMLVEDFKKYMEG